MKIAKFVSLFLAGILSLTSATAVCAEGTMTDIEITAGNEGYSGEEMRTPEQALGGNTEVSGEETETASAALTADRTSDEIPGQQEYNDLIARIKNTAGAAKREALMHEAEDMLMETGVLVPLYYDNDIFLQKESVSGIYSDAFGFKYFMSADDKEDTTLCINLAEEPDTFDPALNSTADGGSLVVNIFEGLCAYDDDGETVMALADRYAKSRDGLHYAFTLKDDLFWSDGTKLTADDFVYAWNRAAGLKMKTDGSSLFDCIARKDDGMLDVTADGSLLMVSLTEPCPYFLDLCALPAYCPVLRSQTETYDWEEDPGVWASGAGFVSSGAYTIDSWIHGERMVLVKNLNYYRADEVKTERIEVTFSTDSEAVFEAYDAGELDFADAVSSEEMQNLTDSPELHNADRAGTCLLYFNTDSPLFEGKTPEEANAIRRALSLLIDRSYITEGIVGKGNKPANTLIPAGMSDGRGGEFRTNDKSYTYPCEEAVGYYDPSYEAYDANLEEAMRLLAENGFEFNEDGMLSSETPLNITYLVRKGTVQEEIAEAVQQDFAVIGVNVTIDSQKQKIFLNRRKNGKFDLIQSSCEAYFDDPVSMLERWMTDSGENNAQLGK